MKKFFGAAIIVFTMFVSVSATAYAYQFSEPTNQSAINSGSLVTSTDQTTINGLLDAAVAGGLQSIPVSLTGSTSDSALSNVRITAQVTNVPSGGQLQLWAKDTSNNWYDIVKTGWGPISGFPVDSTTNNTTNVYPIASVAGSYDVTTNLVNTTDQSTVISTSTTIVIQQATTALVTDESEMNAALANSNIQTITLGNDFSVASTVTIDRSVTIEGNGKVITAAPTVSGSVILITADNVTVHNLSVDGQNLMVQGIQAYKATNVNLNQVTAKNSGKSGIMVNGSTVSVTDVTTSGNGWDGINVDQGGGVTTLAQLTVNGTSAHVEKGPAIYIDNVDHGSVLGDLDQYNSATGTSAAYFLKTTVVTNESEMDTALANQYLSEIKFGSDITSTSTILVNRAVTIDGNGHTLYSDFTKTDNTNNAGIMVEHSDVTIKNLTVDGSNGVKLHGINIYEATGVTLDGVTISHNKYAGVEVNGSIVTANNITTSNNGWGGINVDQGTGVTATTTLIVTGTSKHHETNADIWIDDLRKTLVSVDDSANQYATSTYTHNGSIVGETFNLPVAVTASAGASSVVFTSTSTAPVTVTVPVGINDSKLDLTSLVASSTAKTPVAITVDSDSVDFTIPVGTTITGTNGWDGSIALPHATTQTVTPTVASNETATVGVAISVGSDSAALTFDKAVRLVFAGQADKRAGFAHGSDSLTEITTTCTADDQATNDLLAAGTECKIDSGSDLVVWTKHFTTFATYSVTTAATPAATPVGTFSGGRSSGGGGGSYVAPKAAVAASTPSAAPVVGRVLGASAFKFSAYLKSGMTSDDVSQLQDRLRTEGFFTYPTSTGYFGPVTLAAVKAYQAAKGLPSTGYVGPLTVAKLNESEDPTAAVGAPTASSTATVNAVSAKSFIELLIASGVIPADKAAAARAAVAATN